MGVLRSRIIGILNGGPIGNSTAGEGTEVVMAANRNGLLKGRKTNVY
jgi:hypothetical protein